jgi:PAS domain S-box-containing protein
LLPSSLAVEVRLMADTKPRAAGNHRWADSVAGRAAEIGIVAVVYYLTARLGLSLAFANKNVTTVWPPTGIAVAALVLRGYRLWPGIAIGALTANIANGAPPYVALGFSVGNTAAPLLNAYLLRRFSFHPRLDRVIDVASLAGSGSASMLLSSTLGTSILAGSGGLGSNSYWSVWSTWWVGDALGVLLFAPVIMAFGSTRLSESRIGTNHLEAAACLVSTAVAGYLLLASPLPIQYLVFPFVAWAAIRFRQLGATATILSLCILSIWTTVNGIGPHADLSPTLRLIGLDLFNGTLAVSALLLAAISEERARANLALRRFADHLEQEVTIRTKELADSNAELTKEVATRIATAEALRRQTLEYESMLQAISDLGEGAVVVDLSTRRIRYANDAYCRLTGYSLEELRECDSYLEVLTSDSGSDMTRTTRSIDEAREASAYGEAMILTKDGKEIPVDWASARINYGDREHSIGVVRDATERRRKLEMVEAARDAAQAASRAKGEYLSRMSHELRTPLTIIMGYTDLLSSGGLSAHERRQVDSIMRSAEHLLALVNDVLDIARIEAGKETLKLESIDVAALCKEAATMMSSIAVESGVSLSCDVDGLRCAVKGDRQRLLQVLLNLISNGVKYGGRSVDISLSPATGGTARILVSDTGPGLSETQQMLLFQPFQRLGAEQAGRHGSGLGLALSKALVEGMGGNIGVSSSRNGTTFWVALAIDDTVPAPAPQPTADVPWPRPHEAHRSTRALSILHIEDNPMMIELVESLCRERIDVQLTNAMMGRMGIELARAGRPDLVILDVHLPDMDGAEVLHDLKLDRATRDIPVMILSADATPARITELMDMGASKYMTKPIRLRGFFAILDEAIARRDALTASAVTTGSRAG